MELDFNYKFIGDGNFVRIGSKYKNPTFNTCVVKHLHFLFIRRNLWRIINEKND